MTITDRMWNLEAKQCSCNWKWDKMFIEYHRTRFVFLDTVTNGQCWAVLIEKAGMGSSRTGLDLEDSSRTKFCGLGLGLEDHWPWPWPWQCTASVLRSVGKTLNLWVWLISKGLNTTIQYLTSCTSVQEAAVRRQIQNISIFVSYRTRLANQVLKTYF